jgi:hypothetical protein
VSTIFRVFIVGVLMMVDGRLSIFVKVYRACIVIINNTKMKPLSIYIVIYWKRMGTAKGWETVVVV